MNFFDFFIAKFGNFVKRKNLNSPESIAPLIDGNLQKASFLVLSNGAWISANDKKSRSSLKSFLFKIFVQKQKFLICTKLNKKTCRELHDFNSSIRSSAMWAFKTFHRMTDTFVPAASIVHSAFKLSFTILFMTPQDSLTSFMENAELSI